MNISINYYTYCYCYYYYCRRRRRHHRRRRRRLLLLQESRRTGRSFLSLFVFASLKKINKKL